MYSFCETTAVCFVKAGNKKCDLLAGNKLKINRLKNKLKINLSKQTEVLSSDSDYIDVYGAKGNVEGKR